MSLLRLVFGVKFLVSVRNPDLSRNSEPFRISGAIAQRSEAIAKLILKPFYEFDISDLSEIENE
jgi:hypothetical protein